MIVHAKVGRGPWFRFSTQSKDPARIAEEVLAYALVPKGESRVRVQLRREGSDGIAWFVLRRGRWVVEERGGSGPWDWEVAP